MSIPVVMGILNITPDSFYTRGREKTKDDFLFLAEKMIQEGAAILDLGALSTRPGADALSEEEESRRLLPVLEVITNHFPDTLLSIDTFRSSIAREALHRGAHIINDISGGNFDTQMLAVVKEWHAAYILMHIQGSFSEMHNKQEHQNILKEEADYFDEQLKKWEEYPSVCIDPGFGFGKTMPQNFELLQQLSSLQIFQRPILVGLSRKSMIYQTLHTDADHALNGSTALHMIALQQGANILRVHDVKEAKECITLFQHLNPSH